MRAAVGGRRYDGVASFGRRPMFDTGAVLLEIFLFDFSGDLYGATIDVAFIDWIRDEQCSPRSDDLVRQMQEDSRSAREALARAATRSRRSSAQRILRISCCRPDLRYSRAHCAAMKPSKRDRHDALPAERAAGLDGDAENLRIEQPRRRVRLAARARMARSRTRRRTSALTMAAITAISDEDAGHDQAGKHAAECRETSRSRRRRERRRR